MLPSLNECVSDLFVMRPTAKYLDKTVTLQYVCFLLECVIVIFDMIVTVPEVGLCNIRLVETFTL